MCAIASKPAKPDPDSLERMLRVGLHGHAPGKVCVAFSGGPDSTALLHLLAQMPEARDRGLRALHVDHGLHPDSGKWAEHCRTFCASLDVPLHVARVQVDDTRGDGIEAAARRARHAVFAEELGDGEWLALAHHRDDQIETVLLKLLRGAGPEGLGGMRALRAFARGCLWRPLLEIPRDALRDYVASRGLPCIEDPANADPRFARNVLRNEILPRIAQHWPYADASILHAAQLCRSAADYLAQAAQVALTSVRDTDATLDMAGWLALPDAIRAPVLDRWLRERGLPIPTDAQRTELERQTAKAAEDATPCVAWPGAEVRIWDGRLHATPPLEPLPEGWQAAWNGAPLCLPAGCGRLSFVEQEPPYPDPARFDAPLTVRLRHGGERIQPEGNPHTRELRDLFQQARVPPWVRTRCPLIFERDELIAVADLWASARGKAIFTAHGAHPCWTRPLWLNGA